jgi:phage terminase small subunit
MLRARQAAFVAEYLIDLNATQAAIRAGYSAKVANRIGSENLSKPVIAAAIAEAQARRAERTETTQDYVLARLKQEAEAMGEGASQMGRLRALELIGKHLGMFKERIEHSLGVSHEDRLAELE